MLFSDNDLQARRREYGANIAGKNGTVWMVGLWHKIVFLVSKSARILQSDEPVNTVGNLV